MTDVVEKMVKNLDECSDGEENFFRVNRAMDYYLSVVTPPSLATVARFLFTECLVQVPSRGLEPAHADIAMTLECGRWSHVTGVDRMASFAYATDDVNVDLFKHNRVRINTLIRLGMFYRFTVNVENENFSIYTYNRHVELNGVFWPQYWRDKDKNFSPPVVPMILAVLSKSSSYKNAIARMYSCLGSQFENKVGWRTEAQAQAIIKDCFCRNFLNGLISRMIPSVRAHFKTFEESGLSHDKFVRYVHETALTLPASEGVELTAEFILSLRLPKFKTDELLAIANRAPRKPSVYKSNTLAEGNDVKMEPEGARFAPNDGCDDGARIAPTVGGESARIIPTVGGESARFAPILDAETGVKAMNDNELQHEDTAPCRGVLERGDKKEIINNKENETMSETENGETDDKSEVLTETSSCQSETYNRGVNENTQEDKSLPQEKIDALAFSSTDFNPNIGSPRREKPKAKKSEAQQEMEEYAKMGGNFKRQQASEVAKAKSKNPLDSAHGFVAAFKSIVSGVIPGAKFSAGPFEAKEYIEAQALLDILKLKGSFDETVLRGWMQHTANLNLKNRGYFSVSMMRKTWDSWAPHVPSPDFIARKNAPKKAPQAPKKNVIVESLGQIFASGITPATTFRACQGWGVSITARYLESTGKQAEALIRACLSDKPLVEIKSIFSVTVRFEGAGMEASTWRIQFADMLGKVGRLDEFKVSDFDKAKVGDFISKIKKGASK